MTTSTKTATPSISTLLFRSTRAVSEADWVRGKEEHEWPARRNKTGRAAVSGILARALVQAVNGQIVEASCDSGLYYARVLSRSSPGKDRACGMEESGTGLVLSIPHGAHDKVTYHLGILGLVSALAAPLSATDLVDAYLRLLEEVLARGKLTEDCKPAFCRSADELYYWIRYGTQPAKESNDRLKDTKIFNNSDMPPRKGFVELSTKIFCDAVALRNHLEGTVDIDDAATKIDEDVYGQFVGWQAQALESSLSAGENVLLAGPTGTGKTFALLEVTRLNKMYELVIVEVKEGLIDLDFIGAIIPTNDDQRVWVDGPVLRAMRNASLCPVILFIDEITRVQRHQINMLLGLMNPKSREICAQMGLEVEGDGPFYVLEVPMTSEIVWCPTAHMRIVGAGNFGRAYAVYDLDPAVRRRFDTVLEFNYLSFQQEVDLILRECDVPQLVAEIITKVADETRRMMANGELPGCIDTASLLNWARKCARSGVTTADDVMWQAQMTWADLVCGREHTGKVNQGNFKALSDYLAALGKLSPTGGGK